MSPSGPSISGPSTPGPPPAHRPDLDEAVETWSSMNDASILRSVAAVILGFVVLTLGSVLTGRLLLSLFGVEPEANPGAAFIFTSLGVRLVVTVLAGLLTAWAAPRAPRLHAGVLAAILVFFSLASLAGLSMSGDPYGPAWYPIVMLVAGPVGVLAGGVLRPRRR